MATCSVQDLLNDATTSQFVSLSEGDKLSVILQLLCNVSSGGSGQPTATYAADQALTEAQMIGTVVYVTGAATITLPAVASGMSVTIITIGAVAVSIDPQADDLIYLDGTALDDGDKITNLSTTGDTAVITYYDGTGWYATTNAWTDGG